MESIRHQFKALLPVFFAVYLPVFFILCILLIMNLQGVDTDYLTRDPASIMRAKFYIGIISNIGVLLWGFTTAICIFSFAILRKITDKKEISLFFLSSGIITLLLLLDDFFLIHETFGEIGIRERFSFGGYALLVLIGCIVFRKVILKTEFIFLLFASVFFVLSLCFDALRFSHGSVLHYLEDATKFVGIVSWFLYFTRTCFKEMFSCVKASLM